MKEDVFDFEYSLRNAYSVLERTERIRDEDKELVRAFVSQLKAQGVSTGRLAKYLYHLKTIGENLEAGFKGAQRADIERFMSWLRDEKYKAQTILDFVLVLKRFFKFVEYGNTDRELPYPENVRWLRKTLKHSETVQPEFLTAQEVEAMIIASSKPRDRAMLAVGFEAGLRASELLSLNLADLSFDSKGARIWVTGKTGQRIVRLISSVALLTRYLETHPRRADPSAPLWLTEATNFKNQRMSWVRWDRVLKDLAVKAGIKKRVHNHMLRHGSATENARYLTDSELKVRYGWTMGSKMPAVYVHLNGADLDDKLESIYSGRAVSPPQPKFTPVKCARCGDNNSPGVRFCKTCGTSLDPAELARESIEMEQLRSEIREMRTLLASRLSSQPSQEVSGASRFQTE